MEWLFSLYVAATAFGGSLILVSLFFGGADKDFDKDFEIDSDVDVDADADVEFDADADADADLDADVEADGAVEAIDKDLSGHLASGATQGSDAIWLPFLSLRFWTFGLASFGLTGVLLSLLMVADVPTLVSAVVAGGGIGTGAAWFFQRIKTDSVSGETGYERYAGEEAKVVLPVRPGAMGKIVVQTLVGRVEMLATTRDANPIERGDKVLIAHVRNGVADVSRLSPIRSASARSEAAAQQAAARRKQSVDPGRNQSG